jgi:hypothetical protein
LLLADRPSKIGADPIFFIAVLLLPDNWTEYTSTSENLEQVPVTIKYGSNRKSTNPDLPQMQTEFFFFFHNCNKKNLVGPNFGGSVGQQQTNLFLF